MMATMWRCGIAFALLSACNQWVRPNPPPPVERSQQDQRAAAVAVESYCDSFGDGRLARGGLGSGVMVTDWQVLTAIHVVDCPSAVARIRVTNARGQRWNFVFEREWVNTWIEGRKDGIARIQLASGDTLRPRLPPPVVREGRTVMWQALYLQAGNPTQEERLVHSTGWMYGGATYGGEVLTYTGSTIHGNSGGGLYDLDGGLVGVHIGRINHDTLGFAMAVTEEMVP